jgi:hypothetical protein
MVDMTKSRWTSSHTIAIIVIAVLILLIGLAASLWNRVFGFTGPSSGRLWAWLLTMVLLLTFAATVGHGITGIWTGVLIDDRNRMSLSRLQMILWTIVVLAAFLTAALSNVVLSPLGTPLAIAIPGELLVAMGISITSLIGTPLILSTKSATPNAAEQAQTMESLAARGVVPAVLGNKGLIITKRSFQDAQVADLFRGEETGNAAQLDLGKVQMFYVTLILVLAYVLAIGASFTSATGEITMLPRVDASFVALLGLSHVGYLTYKAFPHSKTQGDTVTLPITPQASPDSGQVRLDQTAAVATTGGESAQ